MRDIFSEEGLTIRKTYAITGDTTSNASLTVRLSPSDLAIIDKKVEEGRFTSRSDAIRHSIRKTIHGIDELDNRLDILADIASDRDITQDDVRKAVRKARAEVFAEVYGQ